VKDLVAPAATRQDAPLVALIADRDAETRRMYAEFLASSDCRIEQADDGRDALAKVFSRQPDIVITETHLPGINGFELCALLRQDTATRSIPIVLVAAEKIDIDIDTEVERAENAGADAVLTKPCPPATLFAEIRRLVHLSADLRERSRAARERMHGQIARSETLLDRSRVGRRMLNSTHTRHDTTTPPIPPPLLKCPECDQPLRYVRSHIGGVTAQNSEQWDYFECPGTCGPYQYRERTRKLRRV
jgi:two-component system, cell cycle response regulator DivK